MNIRYRVELSQDERDQLTALLSGGKHPARRLKRAQILLAADSGVSDEDIARFRSSEAAWTFWTVQAAWYRRTATHWVTRAKRPETRERRLAQLITDSEAGRRLGHLSRDK